MRRHVVAAVVVLAFAAGARAQVTYGRIASAQPGSWLTYSGSYDGHRYSPLEAINTANVAKLRPAWVYQFEQGGRIETTPIVADGVMYVTAAGSVTALDVRSGRPLWNWRRDLPRDIRPYGFKRVNRGVAILGGNVYVGTLDAHLVALDARSGAVRWDVMVADYRQSYAITSAPLAIDGMVVIGVSGGEAGIRGLLDAYDAATGRRRWRFWTIPAPGERGSETWKGDSWKTGGGPTWMPGAWDPQLGLLYWGIGNPGPDWSGDQRAGDNLYTCSVVALDARSGKLRWHFQFTPHDDHDWDANQIPVLIDGEVGGRPRKLLATANRNGFYYLLDRVTGEFLGAKAFVRQNWARAIGPKGRPVVNPGTSPSPKGAVVYPGEAGATNWYSPSYSPRTRLFYVAVAESGAVYYSGDARYVAGRMFVGGGVQPLSGERPWGAVRALDAMTGERRWEFRLTSPGWAGVMSTAGGLVFGGTAEGNFFALDAASGRPLWDFQTGGSIAASPISFEVDGRQFVAVAAGQSIFVFGL